MSEVLRPKQWPSPRKSRHGRWVVFITCSDGVRRRFRSVADESVQPARRSLPLDLRFAILARDGFTCHYCGVHAPKAQLHVDHVMPVARGGTDDPANLVTACIPCNLGKSDRWEASGG